jgi:hypothetical protein
MTPKQAEAWREFTAHEDAKFDSARRKLAAELRAESVQQAAQTS